MPGTSLQDLPPELALGLGELIGAAQAALGTDLHSVVLFGSAAEGRLRPSSDVNLMLVLERLEPVALRTLGPALRLARSSLRLSAMIILRSELALATEAFAVKFADMRHRHRVLFGPDPLVAAPSRAAALSRLRQILLNFVLRERERYALDAEDEATLARDLAQVAGPLRAAAALLLELEGTAVASPREALELLAVRHQGELGRQAMGDLSAAREGQVLAAGRASAALLGLLQLAEALGAEARTLE